MTAIAQQLDLSPTTRRSNAADPSRSRRWTARVLTGATVSFLLFDGVIKLVQIQAVTDGMNQLGYSPNLAVGIGVLLLSCLALYVVPRTAVLGALLLTGYLGGAVATHVRVGNPLFSHVLFPVYLGIVLWGGLYLRDARVRALIPFRGIDA